jgi:hypothetical protein
MACQDGCIETNINCQQVDAKCPPECNCTTNDVVYNGANNPCTGVTYNSKLTDVINKITTFAKTKLFSITGSKSIKATPLNTDCAKTVALEVIVSQQGDNILTLQEDGLYAAPTDIPEPDYKVKVDETDTPDYLVNQVEGTENGLVKIDVTNTDGLLTFTPSLDLSALLDQIKEQYGDKFCELVASCINYTWVADTYRCRDSDLDLITQRSITGLPNPIYSFEDNERLYFVSGSNNVGKVWSIDIATAQTASDIEYLKETRSGQPYGANGGTYTSGANYTGNSATGTGFPLAIGAFYDKSSRTLYIHTGRSNGCDYYDFSTGVWGKISTGTTGSQYNTSVSDDYFTHVSLFSNDNTDVIVTGWGTSASNRGANVITISKSNKALISEVVTTSGTTFPGITGNPFNNLWGCFATADGRLFIAKNNASTYRNIAVFNSNLTPIIEIVPAHSLTGFSSQATKYWQNAFIDVENNKFYNNDFMSRTVEVYDTTNYSLLKTFHLDNNRNYTTAAVSYSPITSGNNELYFDIVYGGISELESDDAPISEMVTYKINRSSLDIEKIYIGTPRAHQLIKLSDGSLVSTTSGDINPTSPTSNGIANFYITNPNSLKNGIVDILTLKEVNETNNIPTGNTKINSTANADYIAPHTDLNLCTVNYTLNAPSSIITTVTPTRYDIEFGLNDDVVLNPQLAKIRADFYNGATLVATIYWNVPNVPNPNAFFKSGTTSLTVGDTITVNLQYLNISNTPIATYNNIRSVTVVADI